MYRQNYMIPPGSYPVTVGPTTPGNANNTSSNAGAPSSAFGITAKGGGAGANENADDASGLNAFGGSGANGGGASYSYSGATKHSGIGVILSVPTGWLTYGGYRGGMGSYATDPYPYYACGGGGGAVGPGLDFNKASPWLGGDGGPGVAIRINGTLYYWGAGGGGAVFNSNGTATYVRGGNGGVGGGGGASVMGAFISPLVAGVAGLQGYSTGTDGSIGRNNTGGRGGDLTGSGGGGGSDDFGLGGSGGSGVVIISYTANMTIAAFNTSTNFFDCYTATICFSPNFFMVTDRTVSTNRICQVCPNNTKTSENNALFCRNNIYALNGYTNTTAAISCLSLYTLYNDTSGVRWINPAAPFQAYCDQSDGGGWMTIMQINKSYYSPVTALAFGNPLSSVVDNTAKLADDQINYASGDEQVYKWYGAFSSISTYVRTSAKFDDTQNAQNLFQMLYYGCRSVSFSNCAWYNNGAAHSVLDTLYDTNHFPPGSPNDCNRMFMLDNYGFGNVCTNCRCVSAGISCSGATPNHPPIYPIRFYIYLKRRYSFFFFFFVI